MKRNPNRGVVLRLDDAAVIHRMLEFWLHDRRFDNPIVASETQAQVRDATVRLEQKLVAIIEAHHAR
jgi:hypothetical protein